MTIMTQTAYRGHCVPSLRNMSTREARTEEQDLLDLVPEDVTVDLRSSGQIKFMEDLISQITELDAETGAKALAYTVGMTERGKWTPGREGNASAWIDRMLAKRAELMAASRQPEPTTDQVEIPANNYAIEHEGEVKCYSLQYGREGTRWARFIFLDRISSDNEFPIKNPAEKTRILAAIAADVDGAATLAAVTLRKCKHCHRRLSDTKNPYFLQGLGPVCGGGE